MLIIETFVLYLRLSNSQTNLTTMKKQEMIDVMIAEEKQLWKEMQECIDRLGMHDSITDMQIARWATVKNLIEKLQIK